MRQIFVHQVFVHHVFARLTALALLCLAYIGAADAATVVVHHSRDVCKFTLPSGAQQFVAWSHGKARLHWINTSCEPSDTPCNARGAHGFFRPDGPAVSAIIGFVKSR